MKKFGIEGEGFDLKVAWLFEHSNSEMKAQGRRIFIFPRPQVMKRGMAPGGGGEVVFTCPVRKTIRPVQLTEPGKIKRIRGVAYPSHHLTL